MGIARGCQAYIIREGWEGLVRGNNTPLDTEDAPSPAPSQTPTPALSRSTSTVHLPPSQRIARQNKVSERNQYFTEAGEPLGHLSYGFGELLLSGSAEGEIEADGLEEGRAAVGGVQETEGKKTLKGTYIVRVGWDDVRGWLGEGGTLIGSSRCPSCEFRICVEKVVRHLADPPFVCAAVRTREGRLKAAANLIHFGIDCLAVCGGDGSLTGADMLRKEWPSLVGELLDNKRITKVQAETFAHLNIVGLVGSIEYVRVGGRCEGDGLADSSSYGDVLATTWP